MTNVFFLFAGASAALAAVIDWRTGSIPNWLSIGALVLAVALHVADGGWPAGGWSLVGASVCAIVPLAFWRMGGFGGGDVKMLAAIGAVLLPLQGIEAEFYAFFAVAILSPARLVWEGRLFAVLGNAAAFAASPLLPKARRRCLRPEVLTPVRFGPALLAGVAGDVIAHWRGG